ncbi:protein unc-93 homolog A-like isoform X2 [Mytilus trossulus]|uniref:protein unc-93 homolog A-like isoform X2 n=1 Tax=Mytilus trossulus TaxID=6551 RepID=UPI003007C528
MFRESGKQNNNGEDSMVDIKAANMSKEEHKARRNKKRQLLFNFSALCLIWLFSFTAYSGLINLEASLHADTGLYSLFAITFGGVIACTFAPSVIARLGPKGSLILACLFQTVYVIANYYPKAYILISGGAISGLASGLMWTVQGCYITSIAVDYLRFDLSHTSLGSVLSKLSGLFYMAFQSTQIFGNLISSVVFQFGETTLKFSNNSFCGANFCPSDMNIHVPMNHSQNTTIETTHMDASNHDSVNVLISIYLACTVVALLICIFGLRPIESSMSEKYETFKERFASSWGLLFKDLKVLLVVPLYFYIGMQLIVMFVQFTRSFTACRLGVGWIGYTMLCFGAADTVGSLVFGYIGKYTGRIPLFLLATVLELGLLAFMMLWDITNDTSAIFFFLIPLAWGLCDSIWMTQSMALVGSAFHKNPETTFALCILFQALGSAVAYIYNIYICEYLKIYIVSITLVISVFLVLILEIRIRRADKIRKNQVKTENVNSVKESLLEQEIPHIYPVDKA